MQHLCHILSTTIPITEHTFSPGGFSIMFTEFEPGDHVLVIIFTDSDGEQASQSFPFNVPPRLGELVMS